MFNGNAARRIEVPERRLELVRNPEVIEAIRQGPRGGMRAARGPRVGLRGVLDEDFLPTHIPGCQLFCCGDTGRFPTAIVVPADPTVDGDFEAADMAAWTVSNCTATKEAGWVGSRCARIAYDGSHSAGGIYQMRTVVGNWYRAIGQMRGDGTSAPRFLGDGVTYHWTGTASSTPQSFDVTYQAANTYGPQFNSVNLSAGHYVEVDDFHLYPLNSSQFTDLSGAGHHLVQATAASQPLVVSSGAGSVLRFDGTADWLGITDAWVTSTFGGADPAWTVIHCGRLNTRAASETLWSVGNTGTSTPYMRKYTLDGSSAVRGYKRDDAAAAAFGTVDTIANTNTHFFADVCTGTTWQHWIDTTAQAAQSVDTGATTLTHMTLAAHRTSGAASDFCPEDIWAWIVYNRALSNADLGRLYRWYLRQKARLGL